MARATTSVWLAGDDDWWFGGDNGDRMDVVPEQKTVAADGVARLQVRMPFREATALVSVLRDGVIDSFVTTLSGSNPVIEVKMKGRYAPNVHVSVLAVRGRVAGWRLWLADLARRWNLPNWLPLISREAGSPTALVDLAKPSYRIGITTLQVGWDAHALAVKVASDKPSYAVRSPATAIITVTPPKGRTLPKDAEIAFAAVDEALLQLRGNDSWDVLAAMMAPRPLAVVMATAQTQVVGKRHYGRKAVAAGGGGGDMAGMARRDFNPVLLWRASVPLDARGQAVVPLKLNDSLSGFRLVAVATAGADLFGTGSTSIRTTQDLQILPGIPPVVRSGDDYVATMLARNATTAPMQVQIGGTAGAITLPQQARTIPAGGAANIAWRIIAPAKGPVAWQITARSATASDAVSLSQAVLPAVPDQILQATLIQPGTALPIALPPGALPGRGGIDVTLSASLGGDLPGVRAFMAAYPYDCIEQRLSRAVATGDRPAWDRAAQSLAGYLDGNGLARFFPGDWLAGDAELTAYILDLAGQSGWPLPSAPRDRMVSALSAVAAGQSTTTLADVPTRIAVLAALSRAGALAPALLDSIAFTPNSWPVATLIDWISITERLPARADQARQAEAMLHTRLDRQGTVLRLARDERTGLLTSADATAAKLLGFATPRPAWRADSPLLARALMLRQRAGHWDTTPANALGTLAIAGFQRRFEAIPVSGTTQISLGNAVRSVDWAAPQPQSLPWPPTKAPLTLRHTGAGTPWATVSVRAAVPLAAPFTAGFAATRSLSPVAQAVPGRWTRGDVLRVTITITPRAPVEWVVINDPVPTGATILGGTLGGRSEMLGQDATTGTSPSFVERRTNAIHAHYAALGRAPVSYSYTLRLGSTGRFQLPPTRIEALYSPEMVALLPNAAVVVAPVR